MFSQLEHVTYCLIVGRVDRKLHELKSPRMKLGVSGEITCRVCQGRSSSGCARGDHLQGVSGEITCRVCQGISSAGRVRGDHLQGASGEIICRACQGDHLQSVDCVGHI